MGPSFLWGVSGQKKTPAWGEGDDARARRRRALGDYDDAGVLSHEPTMMPEKTPKRKSVGGGTTGAPGTGRPATPG
jgi:hypothetical protein